MIMFDLDGTLVDSRADLRTGVNLMRAHYGLAPLSLETVSSYIGNGIHKLAGRSLQGEDHDLEKTVNLIKKHYMDHIHDETTLYPYVHEGLEQMHSAGIAKALITNKPEKPCRELLKHFDIERFFTVIMGGDTVSNIKPDPEPLLAATQECGCPVERAWMIGDHVTDIEAARRAGTRSGFVTYGIGSTGNETPTRVFSSFKEVTEAMLKEHGTV